MIDLAELSAFHFIRPWWLLVFIPITVCVVYLRRVKSPTSEWQNVIAPHLLAALSVGGEKTKWFNPSVIGLIIFFLVVLIAAGPSWERKASPFVEDEASLVIALQLSNSMNQADIQPTRLERAKQKIEDLLTLRGGAKTGLVVYAGTAHTVIPLTNDPDIILQFLYAINSDMMPEMGKFPEKTLPLVERMLSETKIPATLLVVGDGIGSNSVEVFEEYFKESSHQLLVFGIGTGTDTEKTTLSSEEEMEILLPLQIDELKELSDVNNGSYQQITVDKSDVNKINRLINHHLSNVEDANRPWVDAGYILLFPLGLVSLLWFRKGWTLKLCLAWLLVGNFSGVPKVHAESIDTKTETGTVELTVRSQFVDNFLGLWLTSDQLGRFYFDRGDYQQAAHHFKNMEWKALAFYYHEDFVTAAELFSQIDSVQGLFNLANAFAQGQSYLLARDTYDRVLIEQSNHTGAQKNRAIIQTIIDDINRMSESQRAEEGEASKELGDAPRRAEGADKHMNQDKEIKQFSAEEVLANKQIYDMWMRQVQQDPSRFLRVKFQMQLSRQAVNE